MSREPTKPDAPVTSTGVAMLFLPFRVVGRMPRMGMRYLTVTKLPGATLSNQNVTDASQEKRRDAAVGMIGFPTGLVVDGRSFDRHCQDRSAVDGLSDQSDDGVSGI